MVLYLLLGLLSVCQALIPPNTTCVGWKAVFHCTTTSPRNPEHDRSCTEAVSRSEAGYCECGFGRLVPLGCGHVWHTCEYFCSLLSMPDPEQPLGLNEICEFDRMHRCIHALPGSRMASFCLAHFTSELSKQCQKLEEVWNGVRMHSCDLHSRCRLDLANETSLRCVLQHRNSMSESCLPFLQDLESLWEEFNSKSRSNQEIQDSNPQTTPPEVPSHTMITTQTNPSFKMAVYPEGEDIFVSRTWIIGSGWEMDFLQQLREIFTPYPSAVFLDIGANIGSQSLWLAALERRVIAIEALPATYALFSKSIESNPNMQPFMNPFHIAVSDKSGGSLCFRVDPHNRGHAFATDASDEHKDQKCQPVNILTVDDVLLRAKPGWAEKIFFMKVDVEGLEPRVFKGARNLISGPHAPCYIRFELNQDWASRTGSVEEMIDTVLNAGYSINILQQSRQLTSSRNIPNGLLDLFATKTDMEGCKRRFQ